MAKEIEGTLSGAGVKVAIAVARFNQHIVDGLLAGARDGLARNGVADADVTVARCPGSWELPLLARRLGRTGEVDAIIALGCLIRGDTPHFDYIASECTKGLAQVGLELDLPVVFGVLTTDTVDQAHDRSGLKGGNKGFDVALGALEMVDLLRNL